MKKGSKEILRTIISNQELIMKALKIEVPSKKVDDITPKKKVHKKVIGKPAVKKPLKKSIAK